MTRISPADRLARYGPSTGDRVRLADTDLWVRVGEDRQAQGDEPIWGYAKTLRTRSVQGRPGPSELDVVIAGALVLDPLIGAVKADIGVKDGRIVGVGRAGNGAISDGIELPIGPHTQPIMGYGLIATPGAVDSHVHAISPALLSAGLSGGVTTLITAGFEEPPWAMERTLAGLDGWPVNVGLQAGARIEDDDSLEALLDAGACGFKIHEDYAAYPALIDHVLRFADAHDVTVSLHTDGLHEAAVAAIAGRTVHAYHVEGSGGGHLPDLLGLVREANILCSSTTPTVTFGVNAAAEGVPMNTRPTGRHRPLEAGLLRGKAGVRVQGGFRGLGAARRGQCDRRTRRTDALPARLGRFRAGGRKPVADIRVGARRRGTEPDAPARGGRTFRGAGASHARPDACGPRAQPGHRRDRDRPDRQTRQPRWPSARS